jgi:adenylyltransferase/sulfurtransferase
VLDCTDTPASRYLISDTCVLLGKRLVSASALRIDGQLMVLNNPPLPPGVSGGGPCYRCVFPKPPPPESVVSCGDGGILGPVVGVMGVLQALEAIKVITQQPSPGTAPEPPSLLIFSTYSQPMFRSIRLRSRKPKCAACSSQATISAEALQNGSLDSTQSMRLRHRSGYLLRAMLSFDQASILSPAPSQIKTVTSLSIHENKCSLNSATLMVR